MVLAEFKMMLLPAPLELMVVVEPCSKAVWPVAPTVRAPLGVTVLVFIAVNVGEAVVFISCMVLTAPLVVVKLLLLKLAIPFEAVVASLIVMVLPAALALAMLKAPTKLFNEVTPPEQLPLETQIVPLASGSV